MFTIVAPAADGSLPPPPKSLYGETVYGVDDDGISALFDENGGVHHHPFNVSSQSMGDRGKEGTPSLNLNEVIARSPHPSQSQRLATAWLVENADSLANGAVVWRHPLPLFYTTFTMEAGWPSAFSQARIIHALIYAARTSGDQTLLDLAMAAAKAFETPVESGGLLENLDGYSFFEEVPVGGGHSPHILNGHLYSVVVLLDACKALNSPEIRALAERGVDTIRAFANLYDTGNWTKYDLVPRIDGITFLVRGRFGSDGSRRGSLASVDGNEFPLMRVSENGDQTILKANLPGSIFSKGVLGRPEYRVKLDGWSWVRHIGVAGIRPDVHEYYRLAPTEVRSFSREQSGRRLFRLPLRYLADSVLSRVYQRWHGRLMHRLGEITGDAWFEALGARWQRYDEQIEPDIEATSPAEPRMIDLPEPPGWRAAISSASGASATPSHL